MLTVPGAPASLKALRTLRLLRLLRVLFILAGARRAQRLFGPSGLQFGALIVLVTIVAGGAAFATIEADQGISVWDGTWWAFGVATTAGTEFTPYTTAGRLLSVAITLTGLAFLAQLTAAAAQRFLAPHDRREELTLAHLQEQLDRIERELTRDSR